MIADGLALDSARQLAGITVANLWLRYVTLGGTATRAQLRGVLGGKLKLGAAQYDVLAHALNERFVEMDLGYPVPYADDAA
jgi:hypothetical protein